MNDSDRIAGAVHLSACLTPVLLVALALFHGLLYAWLLPPWQAPDEPTQFEYAALISRLGRIPATADTDPELERQIVDSLVRERFFEYLVGRSLQPSPRSFEDVQQVFFMPRQVGSDPPLYFAIAVLPIWALADLPIETQLLALRLLGVLFTVGAVLCVYGAGRELCIADRRAPRDDRGMPTVDSRPLTTDGRAGWWSIVVGSIAPDRTSGWLLAPLAAGLLAALHPMFVFVDVGAGNDGLANLAGAALCWASLRAVRLGLGPRRVVVLLALALLGLLVKRTLLPQVVLLASIGAWLALRSLVRWPRGHAARLGLAAALLLALTLGMYSVLAGGRDQATAAGWSASPQPAAAPRVLSAPGTGQAALVVRPGQAAIQVLPGPTAEWTQNQNLHFSARVWTAGGAARGRLAIDFGWATTEIPFKAGEQARTVAVHTFVPLYCPYVSVTLRSDVRTIYADRLGAESDRRPGLNVLSNGDVTSPGVRDDTLLARLRRYLRLRELAWAWRSGRLLEPPPLGWGLARIFFVSFWGQFGWMSLPLVGATPWEGALGLVCLGGLLGTLGWLARVDQPSWRRRAIALLLAWILAGLLFPLLNAYTQTRDQVIQQGRYLFPALAPLALLLVLGWRAFLPPRWRVGALVIWTVWWVLFASAALALIVSFYHFR
jgi:hypothetical protein